MFPEKILFRKRNVDQVINFVACACEARTHFRHLVGTVHGNRPGDSVNRPYVSRHERKESERFKSFSYQELTSGAYGFGGAAGFAASPGFGGAPAAVAEPPGRSSSGTARISCSTNDSG